MDPRLDDLRTDSHFQDLVVVSGFRCGVDHRGDLRPYRQTGFRTPKGFRTSETTREMVHQTKSFDTHREAIKTAFLFKWIARATWRPFGTVGYDAAQNQLRYRISQPTGVGFHHPLRTLHRWIAAHPGLDIGGYDDRSSEDDKWLLKLAKGYAAGGECSISLPSTLHYQRGGPDRERWDEMCAECHKTVPMTQERLKDCG